MQWWVCFTPLFQHAAKMLQLWTLVSQHWVYFPPISWLGALIIHIQCNDTQNKGVSVDEYAYYVNKRRQNVGLETWIWRQIVRSQKTAHHKHMTTICHWTPPWEFSPYATGNNLCGPGTKSSGGPCATAIDLLANAMYLRCCEIFNL